MNSDLQNRLRSPILWIGVASLLTLVLKEWFGYEIPAFDSILDSVLGVLALIGVVNNPTNKVGW